jgi:endonuclease/exonuclease/phosphatase family metal-dependent hydrolase
MERLAIDLGMEAYYGEGNHPWAVAWLSRLPILSARNHRLDALFHTLVEIQVAGDPDPVRLFATHLRSLGPQSRMATEAQLRTREVQAILETLRPTFSDPQLLVGDFNATRPGERVAWRPPIPEFMRRYHRVRNARDPVALMLAEGYVDCYRQVHPTGPGYTFTTRCPWERIDFIFASPALANRLVACDVGAVPGSEQASDHFPVWAEFA